MNTTEYNSELFKLLRSSPTAFHAVAFMENELLNHGFLELQENMPWHLQPGNSYFVSREKEAIVAFTAGSDESAIDGYRILAAHTDSPTLRIKPRPEIKAEGYFQLGVEVYGGCLFHPWLDRDLCLAGRVCFHDKLTGLRMQLVDFRKPMLTIPSLALHFDRDANQGKAINAQQHLVPLLATCADHECVDFFTLLKEQIEREHQECQVTEILGFDLFCYDYQAPAYTGVKEDFISSARLDNLLSCCAGVQAIISAGSNRNTLLFCANHEENGSVSATGANGSFFESVLERLADRTEERQIMLRNSFLISLDNSHATHPNYIDKMDKNHHIRLNTGPVIKINANQRYATNSIGSAIFKTICKDAGIPVQEFVMRSDLPCGSTIGPIVSARLGLRTIDIGAASLAMHSIREHTGANDPVLLFRAAKHFLQSDIHKSLGQS
jgi:aspartyl aminopeptidase